ncbi:NAD(P)-binding Rossmann-fold superfamily protein isoform X1 [Wolffia australiana]
MAISSQPSTALFHHRHSFHSGRSLHGRMLPSWTSCRAQKKERGFMDQILDYIEGGPKLRKWYGAPDLLPIDGGSEDEQDLDLETEEPRDAILVTDGDSEIGQMVILALIVNRARVKALVRDKQAAVEAFGSYVEPINGDAKNKTLSKESLRGVRALIIPTNDGSIYDLGQMKGIEHVVLLSQLAAYEGSSGLQALVNANAKKLAAKDEEAVVSSGIPYTIIRAALLEDTPGGSQGFSFKQGVAASGRLSKEDAAYICVEALDIIPPSGLVFEVANGEEKVSDWKEWFALRIPGQER